MRGWVPLTELSAWFISAGLSAPEKVAVKGGREGLGLRFNRRGPCERRRLEPGRWNFPLRCRLHWKAVVTRQLRKQGQRCSWGRRPSCGYMLAQPVP